MSTYYAVQLNATRGGVNRLPEEMRLAEAKRTVKGFLLPEGYSGIIDYDAIPDHLVNDAMARRYLEITPPIAAVIPEFQLIINEIERTYVLGMMFSTVSASCVTIERVLNLARIQLHKHHPKIKQLWGKGPSNNWDENIDALNQWGYLEDDFSAELRQIYKSIRCQYLHSGPITDITTEALKSVIAAYKLLTIFLGFPSDLFQFTSGIECLNDADPRYIEFYLPQQHSED